MHPYNKFPPTFIPSALSCDQFNPFKTVNIAPLTLASFDLTHTVSSPENTLNDCCFLVSRADHIKGLIQPFRVEPFARDGTVGLSTW